jgi:hypothetical protein
MARRTSLYSKIPWTGGLNDSVDPGVLPDNDLTIADNIIYTPSGSRVRREGFEYFDNEIPAVITRSSSGTTRTLIFASSLLSSDDDLLVVGEKIKVSTTATSGNETSYAVTAGVILTITTTNVADDTITYTGSGSLNEGSTSTSGITVVRSQPYICVKDYWRTDASYIKQQILLAVNDQGQIFRYNSDGERKQITKHATATAYATTITKAEIEVFNERAIIAFDGVGNTPKMYHPETDSAAYYDLTGSPPDFSTMKVHLGRLFTNNKLNPDRLEYSSPGNHAEWGGLGDSGALDVSVGDGDPQGITTIFPPFKGILFVAKFTKTYKILGDAPENFFPNEVSSAIGSLSARSVAAIDLDDMLYVSTRGIHSLAATDSYGDFEGQYISTKIQNAFKSFQQGRLKYTSAAYVPELNSVAFAVAEDGSDVQNALYFFNTTVKEWFRWPDVSPQSICTRLTGATKRLVWGTERSRIVTTQNGTYTDFSSSTYLYRTKTGTIYCDGNPQTVKAYKSLSLLYKPKGDFVFTVKAKIDNFSTQSFAFEQDIEGDVLGSTFILGSSLLGADNVLAPFTVPLDGYGRGITLEIESSGTGEQVEIYGFIIEYELADIAQETISS